MSSFPKPNITTFIANSDLSSNQFQFVKLISDSAPGGEQTVDLQTTKGGKTIGILMNAPLAGDMAEVAMPGGGAKLKIGATAHVMDKMISEGTDGKGMPDDAAGQWVGAQSLQEGVSGDVIPVQVLGFESQA